MAELQHLIGNYFWLEIPEDAKDLILGGSDSISHILYFHSRLVEGYTVGVIELPGNYSLIGTTDSMSEEIAAGIVENVYNKKGTRYKDYDTSPAHGWKKDLQAMPFIMATKSFQSLLKSKGITKRCAILQKL